MGGLENGMNILSGFIVYTPLVILSLYLIFLYVRNILKWKNNPDRSWKNEPFGFSLLAIPFLFLFFILKQMFKGVMNIFNFLKKRLSLTIGIFSLIGFLTLSYFYLFKGPYQSLVEYSKIINIILVGTGVLLLFYLFFIENDKVYKESNNFTDKGNWKNMSKNLFVKSSKYLFYLICLGLALAIMALVSYYIFTNEIVQISSVWLITAISSIVILFILYNKLKKIPFIKNILDNNKFFNLLYHFIFILPCLFLETAKFIYNELKNTPKLAYKILFAEIIFIALFIIIPMIGKILYTKMSHDKNKASIIGEKIKGADNELFFLDKEIKKWKNYKPNVVDENGNQKDITTYHLSDNTWDYIIKNDLNNKTNEDLLKRELINNGYNNNNGLNDMIQYVQKYTRKILSLMGNKKDLEKKVEFYKKEEKLPSSGDGKLLIKNPHYLQIKRWKDDDGNFMNYQNLQSKEFLEDFNYNYSISCWMFLHSNSNYLDEYKSILSYNGKPDILYNSYKNTLVIKMQNGKNKEIIYKKKNFKLQKWRNIVINYNRGILDIFIDNNLEATYSSVVPYMNYDKISVGDGEGVSGAICNLVYFPSYMSKTRIETNYNLFKNKSPPI